MFDFSKFINSEKKAFKAKNIANIFPNKFCNDSYLYIKIMSVILFFLNSSSFALANVLCVAIFYYMERYFQLVFLLSLHSLSSFFSLASSTIIYSNRKCFIYHFKFSLLGDMIATFNGNNKGERMWSSRSELLIDIAHYVKDAIILILVMFFFGSFH